MTADTRRSGVAVVSSSRSMMSSGPTGCESTKGSTSVIIGAGAAYRRTVISTDRAELRTDLGARAGHSRAGPSHRMVPGMVRSPADPLAAAALGSGARARRPRPAAPRPRARRPARTPRPRPGVGRGAQRDDVGPLGGPRAHERGRQLVDRVDALGLAAERAGVRDPVDVDAIRARSSANMLLKEAPPCPTCSRSITA